MKISLAEPNRQRGFTLVEVMIALAIIAISLTTIAVVMGAMLNNATTMRDRTFASWIAQNVIVELRLGGTMPELGSRNGDIEYANTFWDWRVEISETGIENLLRIDVSVFHSGEDQPVRMVTGFVGEPAIPGQANQAWLRRQGDRGDTR
jgi:general secretion pathway protein I